MVRGLLRCVYMFMSMFVCMCVFIQQGEEGGTPQDFSRVLRVLNRGRIHHHVGAAQQECKRLTNSPEAENGSAAAADEEMERVVSHPSKRTLHSNKLEELGTGISKCRKFTKHPSVLMRRKCTWAGGLTITAGYKNSLSSRTESEAE